MTIDFKKTLARIVGLENADSFTSPLNPTLGKIIKTVSSKEGRNLLSECAFDMFIGRWHCIAREAVKMSAKEKRLSWYVNELRRLTRRYNFTRPKRYDRATLRSLIRNRLLAKYMPLYDKRPLAVVAAAETDYNNALGPVLYKDLRKLNLTYRTMYYEVAYDHAIVNGALEATQKQKASLLYILGHGTKFSSTMSESSGSLGRIRNALSFYGVDPRILRYIGTGTASLDTILPGRNLLETADIDTMKMLSDRMIEGGHVYVAACSAATGGRYSTSLVHRLAGVFKKQYVHGLGRDSTAKITRDEKGLFNGIVTSNKNPRAPHYAVLINRDKGIFRRYTGKTPWRLKNGVYSARFMSDYRRRKKKREENIRASIPKPDPLVKVGLLSKALEDKDRNVRAAAAAELLMTKLPSDPAKRAMVKHIKASTIARIKNPNEGIDVGHVVRDLLSFGNGQYDRFKETKQIVSIIKKIGKAAIPTLIAVSQRIHRGTMKRNAALALGAMDHREAVPALVEYVGWSGKTSQMIRDTLASSSHALPVLLHNFINDPHKRCSVARCLSMMGAFAAPKLIELLRHKEPGVSRQAAYALGLMDDPYVDHEAIHDALNKATLSENPKLRAYAQWALDKRDGSIYIPSRFESAQCSVPWRYTREEGVRYSSLF